MPANFSKTTAAALEDLKRRITAHFTILEFILFGSVAREDTDKESDLDLLIITDRPLSCELRHQITDIVFEINLEYDTNISTLVVDQASWETGSFSILPIKEEIQKEGFSI